MIIQLDGDMFETNCDVVTNATNSVGVMGGGLARIFFELYPTECKKYNLESKSYQMRFDDCQLIKPVIMEISEKKHKFSYICQFPTKIHYSNPSLLSYVERGLIELRKILSGMENPSIALPALGCGLGGLSYDDVFPLIEKYFTDYPQTVEVYLPK